MTISPPSRLDDAALLERFSRQRDQNALEELTQRYMPLAHRLANRYRHVGEPLEDLVQVANAALVNAIQRFDPERNTAFSSFAVPTILGELKRYFRDHSWSVHVPRDLQERSTKVNRAIDALSKDLGRSPSVREIATKLDLDLEQVLEALQTAQAFNAKSLDAPHAREDEEGPSLGDSIGEEDPQYNLVEYGASMDEALQHMPPRTREVLHLRFVEDMTQVEIAERVGVSQMHVSRIIRGALAELRGAVQGEER